MIRRQSPHRRVAVALVGVALSVLTLPVVVANRFRRSKRVPQRILALEPWGIGDVVLATGALRALRKAYPDARIDVLAKPHASSLVVGPDLADDVIDYDFPWTAFRNKYRLSQYRFGELRALVRSLRRTRYDLVLNARSDVRSNLLGALAGGARFVSVHCGIGDFLATDVVRPTRDSHRTEDWAQVVRAAGVAVSDSLPRLTVDGATQAAVASALGLGRGSARIIGVHPGAAAAVRRWDLGRFAQVMDSLAERYDAKVIVFAEPDGYGSSIPMARPFVVVRRPLRETMAVLSLCDLLVCNDSGPMHIANALGVPVVALFGPGQLEWFAPRGGPSRIVRIADMPCRPCFDACKFATPHCMTRLSEDDVIASAIDLLVEGGVELTRSPASPPAEIHN